MSTFAGVLIINNAILRFDHITKVGFKSEMVPEDGYSFFEKDIGNTVGGLAFMDTNDKTSDLYFYDGILPIELVLYETKSGETDIKLLDDGVKCKASAECIELIADIFHEIGFKLESKSATNTRWKVSGIFNSKELFLYLDMVASDVQTAPINWCGYNCPAFMVVSVKQLWKSIEQNVKYLTGGGGSPFTNRFTVRKWADVRYWFFKYKRTGDLI